ncbi:aromatic ring-hydroxylating oxygenase subunit alpha [Novosphingobium album (ex Hu et al. 2023)]|uniref:Aromatic ring-hydroxylating dioxygenase subunit alpha n=1 Tax=Novosphingobium album (ex Hu et al. 2023) TaxID=2930093 RepID=A0ABT0B7I1_9SPHN|nr:aromatic ring-hydroxylating dioxygenase subunit alpha [Novosphingobium album (ex Hu et al. 2023)]MCJ2180864.1 aromatic ring-hydroxylating dioxygenase subunit alpha [Novosphingobium album (ex Hu et al. 2023)]
MDTSLPISQVDFSQWRMRVPADRYNSDEYAARERENLWMKVWQIAGRAEEIPSPGDWKVHRIFDQSFILVRGKDNAVRGFVNACRHRGNKMCEGKGNSSRFTCRYHNWTFGLDGQLLALAHPDFEGTIEEFAAPKSELGLLPVQVECFAGFIFMNPDRNAAPLSEFLGPVRHVLDAYRMEEWIATGTNVREEMDCNWKVVMDAFGESYHIQGVHTELVGLSDTSRERFAAFGDHCAAAVPFGAASNGDAEEDVRTILGVPVEQFPLYADVLPRFREAVEGYRDENGKLILPEGLAAKDLFRQLIRKDLTSKGYDVSGLTDTQMTDYQYWLLFPNIFLQVCAGDATIIINEPHPDGDHNRCIWHVMFLHWVPEAERSAKAEPVKVMPAGEHYPYHWVLEQDYVQMPIQQEGLRNRLFEDMQLTRSEPRVAHFHSALDRWMA